MYDGLPIPEEFPFREYSESAAQFFFLLLFIWSVFCLSRRPESEHDSVGYSRIRFLARVLALVGLPLCIFIHLRGLFNLGEIDLSEGWPTFWYFPNLVSIAYRCDQLAVQLLALLCLNYLSRLVGRSRLFTWNKVLIWLTAITGLFSEALRVYFNVYLLPRIYDSDKIDHSIFDSWTTFWGIWSLHRLIVVAFTAVLLILFVRFVNRARREAAQMQKNISLLD